MSAPDASSLTDLPLEADWAALQTLLRQYAPLAVAFSGGLDSRFLAFASRAAGCEPVLLHVTGPHIPHQESKQARQWAEERGFVLWELEVNPLALPALIRGDRNRCYHCKRAMFEALLAALRALPPGKSFCLCDGTNASDLTTYRPGLKALRELAVRSPLAEAQVAKPRLRELARHLGMDRPEQQARPCLLTRLEYGLTPTEPLLRQVEQAEACALAALGDVLEKGMGAASGPYRGGTTLPDFRVRVSKDGGMALHVDATWSASAAQALQNALKDRLNKAFGALAPTLELIMGGAVSGYFDRQTASQAEPLL